MCTRCHILVLQVSSPGLPPSSPFPFPDPVPAETLLLLEEAGIGILQLCCDSQKGYRGHSMGSPGTEILSPLHHPLPVRHWATELPSRLRFFYQINEELDALLLLKPNVRSVQFLSFANDKRPKEAASAPRGIHWEDPGHSHGLQGGPQPQAMGRAKQSSPGHPSHRRLWSGPLINGTQL